MDPQQRAKLKAAVDAAKAGDRDEARALVEDILSEDDSSVQAWLLLARISSDRDEQVMALNTVLELDPGNERARAQLDKMGAREVAAEDEVIPGVTRRQVMLVGVVLGAVLLLVIIVIVAATASSNAANTEATRVVLLSTEFESTARALGTIDAIATVTGIFEATQAELTANPRTATPSPAQPRPPTLPPEFTPTPTVTPLISPTPLPSPPPEAVGRILGWGGFDTVQDGYLPVLNIPLSNPAGRSVLSGTSRGENVTRLDNGQILYGRYVSDQFSAELHTLDVEAGTHTLLASVGWPASVEGGVPSRTNMPSVGAGGNFVAFIGQDFNSSSYEVYLYDRSFSGQPEALQRLTADDKNYSFPTMSPNGTQIIVARSENNPDFPARDLYVINVATQAIEPLTFDGDAIYEDMPRYSPDGTRIAYVKRSSPDAPGDIYIRDLSGSTGGEINVTGDAESDDIYPVWSPNGRFLAFASNRSDGYQIFILDGNSGTLYQFTTEAGAEFYPGVWVQ